MQTSQSTVARTGMVPARKYGLMGIGLFLVGFFLGGIGNTVSNGTPIIPIGDTITGLGFVLAVFGAVLAGSSFREILVVGIIFGLGTFYLGEPHSVHIASGIGFGLEHLTHVFIGLAMIGAATVISTVLSFYHTRRVTSTR